MEARERVTSGKHRKGGSHSFLRHYLEMVVVMIASQVFLTSRQIQRSGPESVHALVGFRRAASRHVVLDDMRAVVGERGPDPRAERVGCVTPSRMLVVGGDVAEAGVQPDPDCSSPGPRPAPPSESADRGSPPGAATPP